MIKTIWFAVLYTLFVSCLSAEPANPGENACLRYWESMNLDGVSRTVTNEKLAEIKRIFDQCDSKSDGSTCVLSDDEKWLCFDACFSGDPGIAEKAKTFIVKQNEFQMSLESPNKHDDGFRKLLILFREGDEAIKLWCVSTIGRAYGARSIGFYLCQILDEKAELYLIKAAKDGLKTVEASMSQWDVEGDDGLTYLLDLALGRSDPDMSDCYYGLFRKMKCEAMDSSYTRFLGTSDERIRSVVVKKILESKPDPRAYKLCDDKPNKYCLMSMIDIWEGYGAETVFSYGSLMHAAKNDDVDIREKAIRVLKRHNLWGLSTRKRVSTVIVLILDANEYKDGVTRKEFRISNIEKGTKQIVLTLHYNERDLAIGRIESDKLVSSNNMQKGKVIVILNVGGMLEHEEVVLRVDNRAKPKTTSKISLVSVEAVGVMDANEHYIIRNDMGYNVFVNDACYKKAKSLNETKAIKSDDEDSRDIYVELSGLDLACEECLVMNEWYQYSGGCAGAGELWIHRIQDGKPIQIMHFDDRGTSASIIRDGNRSLLKIVNEKWIYDEKKQYGWSVHEAYLYMCDNGGLRKVFEYSPSDAQCQEGASYERWIETNSDGLWQVTNYEPNPGGNSSFWSNEVMLNSAIPSRRKLIWKEGFLNKKNSRYILGKPQRCLECIVE